MQIRRGNNRKSGKGGLSMRTWKDVRSEIYTAEEIRESDLRVVIIGELIKARQEKTYRNVSLNP